MVTLLNVLWLVVGGGIAVALGWVAAGILMFVSIVGIPWGRACFTLANLALLPFGRTAVRRDVLTGREDIGTGALGTIGNVIWFLLAGIWLAIAHVLIGVACCISLILIPFGLAHFRLARLALFPIGMEVVPIDVARQLAMRSGPPPVPLARP